MNPVTEQSTVPSLLQNIVKHIHPENAVFMTYKSEEVWVEITYKQALEKINAISAYLLDIGIKKNDRLALILDNGPEYVYYDQALQQIGAINTSIYPTLSETEIEYILNDSGARTILVGSTFLFKKILKVANRCPELIRIIPDLDDYQKYLIRLNTTPASFHFQIYWLKANACLSSIKIRLTVAEKAFCPPMYLH